MDGYLAWSGSLKVSSEHLRKSRRGQVCSLQGTRSGQDMVYRMGSRMSGHPNCSRHSAQPQIYVNEPPGYRRHAGRKVLRNVMAVVLYSCQNTSQSGNKNTAAGGLASGFFCTLEFLAYRGERSGTCARMEESWVSTMEWMMDCG